MIAGVQSAPPRVSRLATIVVAVLIVLSLGIRLRNLSSPLTEDHAFRQTQTAMGVWTLATEGIHPFAYQTPVFGPPWRVPMEFPIYQIAAALLVRAGLADIDVASRLTDIFFFYLSAAFLYALCRLHLRSRGAAVCVLLAYLWMPFNIFWSRTAMIDFTSVAFALGYLYFFSRWLVSERAADLAGAVTFGSLMFLAKLTTSPIVAVTMAWLLWERLKGSGTPSLAWLRPRTRLIAGILLATVIPAALGVAWTSYADSVRRASPATEWLAASTSSWNSWNAWNFGTWSERTVWANWSVILGRLGAFLPAGLVVLPLIGLSRATRDRGVGGGFVVTMALGAVLVVTIFFNLFRVHNYYQMCLAPAIAIATGFGLYWLCFEWLPYERLRLMTALLVLAVVQWAAEPYLRQAFSATYADDFAYNVGVAIAEVTKPDERVIVEEHDWSPDFLYYARRKGLMWRGSIVDLPPDAQAKFLASDNFTTVVSFQHRSETARFWPHRTLVRQVGPVTIYKVAF